MAELDSLGRFKNPEDAKAADTAPKKGDTYDLVTGKVDALGKAVEAPKRKTKAQAKAE